VAVYRGGANWVVGFNTLMINEYIRSSNNNTDDHVQVLTLFRFDRVGLGIWLSGNVTRFYQMVKICRNDQCRSKMLTG